MSAKTTQELLEDIRYALDPVPPVNASCHIGIRSAEDCCYCSRLRDAHAAVKELGERYGN